MPYEGPSLANQISRKLGLFDRKLEESHSTHCSYASICMMRYKAAMFKSSIFHVNKINMCQNNNHTEEITDQETTLKPTQWNPPRRYTEAVRRVVGTGDRDVCGSLESPRPLHHSKSTLVRGSRWDYTPLPF